MALLKIRKFPDPALKQPASPVCNIDGKLATLIDSMVQTMYAAPGVGLAAPRMATSGSGSHTIDPNFDLVANDVISFVPFPSPP